MKYKLSLRLEVESPEEAQQLCDGLVAFLANQERKVIATQLHEDPDPDPRAKAEMSE